MIKLELLFGVVSSATGLGCLRPVPRGLALKTDAEETHSISWVELKNSFLPDGGGTALKQPKAVAPTRAVHDWVYPQMRRAGQARRRRRAQCMWNYTFSEPDEVWRSPPQADGATANRELL